MSNKARMLFVRRRNRVRSKIKAVVGDRLRLCVFRSAKNMYVQIIDDSKGRTMVSASSLESGLDARGNNSLQTARHLGTLAAERAQAAGIDVVYFDRGGYLYHGRVKALAEAAREAGLKF